ncbi:hypothetical protein KCU78_g1561, partial [Aureobasidium melanogenum]
MDSDQASEEDFRGVLDVELSQLLRATREKTKNGTLILDCCQSGRMARQPGYGDRARPKSLTRVYHRNISKYIEQCPSQGRLLGETHLEGNPSAVRITAAATTESAFEYTNSAGKVYGTMTEILASAIGEGYGQNVSWRTTLMRVRKSVSVNFPQQHPCAEGPNTRLHFSTKQLDPSRTRNFVLKVEASRPTLRAGRGVLSVPAKAVVYWRSMEARVNSPDAEYKNRTLQGQPSLELEGRIYAALRTFQEATSTVFMLTDQN